MAGDATRAPRPPLAGVRPSRWDEVLGLLVQLIPPGPARVVVDGAGAVTGTVADRLAAFLSAAARPASREVAESPQGTEEATVAAGPHWRAHPPSGGWDVTIWLRTGEKSLDGERGADIVVDLHDPAWPVIRRDAAQLADHNCWYISESRAFFAARAATWDTKFGGDLPAYATAVAESGIRRGAVAIDVGCGTGRALPALRSAVGPDGRVIGLDLTPQMLAVAARHIGAAALILGDARALPVGTATVDVVFAAGLVMHLPDTDAGLRELARITRPGGRLVLFHPSGRIALAARHGRTTRTDEPLAEHPLRAATGRTGWRLDTYDDPPHRFYAAATRC